LFSFAQKDDLNLLNQDLPRINDLAAKIKADKNSLIFLSVFPIQYLALIAANPWEIDNIETTTKPCKQANTSNQPYKRSMYFSAT